ncbi:macro domain-containing protein [Lentzea fradiae]|uniref:macro domain-containing protein n=1 Tax=Lentzea fradiae TaxID=200378 RepID=UPI001C409A83|nr:macro domain-containing protein [Lentzea fradiae]
MDAETDALVNAVNCVGVMGKGLALQFKQRFPAYFDAYASACAAGEVRLGRVHVTRLDRWFVSFPTKRHFRSRSKLSDIASGLDDLARVVGELGLRSVAVPPLGAGLGGLAWAEVEPLIEEKLGRLDAAVAVFSPGNAARLGL